MSPAPRRIAASVVGLVIVLSSIFSIFAGAALAQQGTITRADCSQGRIHDRNGKAIAMSRCERLVGKSVTLASTGFEIWPLALAGFVCVAGAAALRRSARGAPGTV
ncbi:MAG: hypothetical protein NVSMB25_13800 [Thermoleophilaceae bacterium]